MFSIGISIGSHSTQCNGELVVPYNGGLSKAICINYDDLLARSQSINKHYDMSSSISTGVTQHWIDVSNTTT